VTAIENSPVAAQDSCVDLDEIDYHLLDLVQVDATLPLHVLGERIGLSPSAVQRRLTRLRTAGVITAEVALVDQRAVNAGQTAVVLVALVDDDPEHHEGFRERMLAEPGVQQCYCIVGQWDFVVVLVTADLAENRLLSRRLFGPGSAVHRYETLPSYEAVKPGHTVPLPVSTAGQ
jgi:Lrp/AsnC family leucine-responsive transcriptional regulator